MVVVLGGDGVACRSTDGGKTWMSASLGEAITQLLWAGDQFVTCSSSKRYRSADGKTWTSDDLAQPTQLGPVGVSAKGTFVAAPGGWQNWYDKQEFYRSTDGLTWTKLPDGAYQKSHRMQFFVAGEGVCPK